MQNTISLYVSSLTGNTQKIANHIADHLKSLGYSVELHDVSDHNISINADHRNIVCFWCRRSSLDDLSKKFLDQFYGISFLAVGTCGHYPDSEYSSHVKENVEEYINRQNHCVDVFLSQGAVNPARTEYRRKLPENHPHHLDEVGLARHLESLKHPNEQDFLNALQFVDSYIH